MDTLSPCRKAAKVRASSALGVRLRRLVTKDMAMKPRVNSHNHSIPVENSNTIHQWKSRARNSDGLSARLLHFCEKDSGNSFGAYQTNGR